MKVVSTATALILALCGSMSEYRLAHAEEVDILQVTSAAGDAQQLFFVASATFGTQLPREQDDRGDPFRLVHADISIDCERIETVTRVDDATAVLVDRGGSCSFVQKAMAVQTAGASLAVVADTVQGAFASAKQSGRAIHDCSTGRGVVAHNATSSSTYPAVDQAESGLTTCTASEACVTNTCVYTGNHKEGGEFEVCCFANSLVRMGADATSLTLAAGISIPAVFLSYRDSLVIKERLRTDTSSVSVLAFNAEESPWNVSMLLTWLLGTAVVSGGAYCSATDERRFSYEKVAMGFDSGMDSEADYISIDDREPHQQTTTEEEDNGNDRVQLSMHHALFFVVGSSTTLVMLYYGHLALVMNVLFLVASASSMAQVVVLPLLVSALPLQSVSPPRREWLWPILSLVVASPISIYWFIHRASSSIWPLQDLLCISLCFVVIDSIHLPSLRVATALLGAAFLYDVFFVYVSPLIFGSSVMVDVASGGGNVQVASASASPLSVHDKLPMVLTIPLLFSYYGGNALLGLGDLVLPGLLVSFCIRYDYCMGHPISRNYFMSASCSYALGLLLANIAAVALRDVVPGQPALMYIVPVMLGAVTLLASQKGELEELWSGPGCLRMDHPLVLGLKAERHPRREEVEPFFKKK